MGMEMVNGGLGLRNGDMEWLNGGVKMVKGVAELMNGDMELMKGDKNWVIGGDLLTVCVTVYGNGDKICADCERIFWDTVKFRRDTVM